MSWVVRVIGPTGMETYLKWSHTLNAYRATDWLHRATRYEARDDAERAGQAYRERYANQLFVWDVVDLDADGGATE